MLGAAPFLCGMRFSRSFALVAGFPAAFAVHGQSIEAARGAALGATVSFTGVVTSGASLGPVRFLQDATGGIAVFPGTGSAPGFAPQVGDAMEIQGVLTDYNGLLEVTPVTAHTVTASGQPLPAAQVITPIALGEAVEGRLVRINGVAFLGAGNFTAGAWTISAGGQYAEVYLAAGHPLVGTPVPTGPVDVVGIASQYDPSLPYTSGYQLLPRGVDDLMVDASIAFLPPVTQSAITTGGFTLAWATTVPGTSQVRYGTTPALGSLAGDPTPATAHAAALTGLQPATFYYAQAFSVDGTDTAFSDVGLYATASTSSGAIRVYFNRSTDHSVSTGVDAASLFQATDDTIKAYIDRAQSTLDIAMYNTSSTMLVAAVNAAVSRGVQVRWIAEGSNTNSALASLNSIVPVLYREDGLGSGTHDKFFVIDAESADRAWVMGGSCNWTNQGFFDDYNNLVFIQDQSLAKCYRAEFEEMWGGSGPQPDPSNSRFGAAKTDNTPHWFNIGGVPVESRFSPTDGTTARIISALDAAQHNVQLALYVFTENSLADAVVHAHARPGVTVRGDMEEVWFSGSEFNYLVGQGVEMYSHYSEPGLLHHKYAIIDEGTPDAVVVTGSHNWTATAESVNDENTLFIHDPVIANLFFQEWTARHQAVAGIDAADAPALLTTFPNPVRERLWVRTRLQQGTVAIADAVGREVSVVPFRADAAIDVGGLRAGAYLFTLRDARGRLAGTGRFIKE